MYQLGAMSVEREPVDLGAVWRVQRDGARRGHLESAQPGNHVQFHCLLLTFLVKVWNDPGTRRRSGSLRGCVGSVSDLKEVVGG